ncbi:hypothetical protein BD626DRAFT_29524 [Schizophyllum amplum]|uniref:F-box domain-containing protein n=1 Tax=Schizophyllum amplum TaxID=97359 RepID=A0A550D0B8_9AGAR|nr:hypothetical protein BD626DRAFT_29524 [Auriculariopsis ampla]
MRTGHGHAPVAQEEAAKLYTLEHLSLDVLTVIAAFLLPVDIIALRKTCKTLATYDLNNMSLTMLEHTATAPSRFLHLLRKHDTAGGGPHGTLYPMARQSLTLRLPMRPGMVPVKGDHFKDMLLVPGGRFLLATSQKHFHIWDLGENAYRGIKPLPIYVDDLRKMLGVSTEALRNNSPNMTIYGAEQHGKIILAMDCKGNGPGTVREVHVFEATLDPKGTDPVAVHRLGKLECAFAVYLTSLSDPYIIIYAPYNQNATLVVWNYRRHTLANLSEDQHFQAFIVGSSLIVPHWLGSALTVHRLPSPNAFRPTPRHPVTDADFHGQSGNLPMTTYVPNDGTWTLHKPWFYRSDALPEFASISETHIGHIAMTEILAPNTRGTLPEHLPELTVRLPHNIQDADLLQSHREGARCEDHTAVLFGNSTCMAYRAATDASVAAPVVVALAHGKECVQNDFCPASGRLCLLLQPLDQNSPSEILVWDFLVPDRAI